MDGKSKQPRIQVVADSAEERSGIPDLLLHSGVDIRVGPLRAGDYLVQGRTLVERKTVSDFSLSLCQGRLFPQIRESLAVSREVVLVVEGGTGYFEGMEAAHLRGAVLSVLLSWRVPVVHTRDTEGTVALLLALGRRNLRYPKPTTVTSDCFGRKRAAPDAHEAQRLVLARVPLVGRRLADRLLDRFGTLGNVARASEEDLGSVQGMGPARAKALRDVLGEQPAHYAA